MLYQIYDSEGEQQCLLSSTRNDNEDVENDIKDAFAQANINEDHDNILEEVEEILMKKNIERVYVNELTIH